MSTIKDYNIVIVEDDTLSRFTLKKMIHLKNNKYVSADFDNAEDCIKHIKDNQVDLIIMDASLPNMNGIEASKAIKNINPDIKIIILTPETSEANIINTLLAKADGYFIRDFKQDNLQKVISYTMDGHGGIDKRMQFSLFNYINKLPNNIYSEFTGTLTSNESKYITLTINGFSKSEIAKHFDMPVANLYHFIYSILEKLQSKIGFENLYQEMKYDLC
ncbi:MAG: response regulator transcription factor [Candidatus Gastranaerophilales bacterium]|nr:response regulator transcription factor [Candidatus Gastranaerophilales bacterium]